MMRVFFNALRARGKAAGTSFFWQKTYCRVSNFI